LPAVTGSGLSVLVTSRSASVLTRVLAEPVLLPRTGSVVVELAVELLDRIVPVGRRGIDDRVDDDDDRVAGGDRARG
jgi:hypothetical protein